MGEGSFMRRFSFLEGFDEFLKGFGQGLDRFLCGGRKIMLHRCRPPIQILR